MSTANLITWIENNLDVDYEDLDSRNAVQARLIRDARGIARRRGTEGYSRGFEAAVYGGFGDQYLEPIVDLHTDIEEAEEMADLPPEADILAVQPTFRTPLEEGRGDKVDEIREITFGELQKRVPKAKPEKLLREVRKEEREEDITGEQADVLEGQIGEQIEKADVYLDLRDRIFTEAATPEDADALVGEGEAAGLSETHMRSLRRARDQRF